MYLTVFAGAGTTFVFCSFWVYHYVHLDLDADGSGYHSSDYGGAGLGTMLTPFVEEVVEDGPSESKLDRRHTSFS
jgi:hypothetical protein